MNNIKYIVLFALLLNFSVNYSQRGPQIAKIKITGTVIEKVSKQPLEYATITFLNAKYPKAKTGGITNTRGEFSVDVNPGVYDIKIEFISFTPVILKQMKLLESTNLGQIVLLEDATQLNEVVIRTEKTSVSIKLDKKVYNVGNDLLVKGGTVSDVLDNIPSVTVDADGTVNLRGNSNVRILIDGRPSNAIDITEALRQIPADAIDKVEVITNPSARYDSEGGAGLLNIILKKGKTTGLNGVIIASGGSPENYGLSGNINFKSKNFNIFTTTGYNYRTNPGKFKTNTEYLNPDASTKNYINESRNNSRLREGYNSNYGIDLYLNESTTWSNAINLRKSNGNNPETVNYSYFDKNQLFTNSNSRINQQNSNGIDAEYTTNFTKKFGKDGHKLSIDGAFSGENDTDRAVIKSNTKDQTSNIQKQNENLIQTDYVLPFGKASQFEAGYKGNFKKLNTDYKVGNLDDSGNYTPNNQYTNILDYRENINALYTQLGTKINKFSVLLGMRWEDSNIQINQLVTNDFNTKKYNNFFPSAFLTYELSNESSVSISYSKRVSRPRGRMINPFSNFSSNINIFKGNPDLNPAFTNAFDFGYLKNWNKLVFNTSAYYNKTTNSFQFIRRESGDFVYTAVGGADIFASNGTVVTVVDGPDIKTPVILSSPINLATELRYGFEFTLNYSPYKWWKLNSNFNFFKVITEGDYTYTNSQNVIVNQNFDNATYSWFTRLSSKVNLPYKIDWQTSATYNGPQNSAQGHTYGMFGINLGFSKDVFKEKATFALNVQDLFNSQKRKYDTNLLNVLNSYSEMQWRTRQINFSFTYRFNKAKEKEKRQPSNGGGSENGGEDF